ncbi:putative peptidoglycan binding protein [Streptomyces sp. 3211.6]|uniref:peptidoglycan-binding domain-containing protein n=1 Tax=Streptomyces TaxID=1883 RepID=UPI0009A50E2A|nr:MULTISPECIES: peptidoglycan-binding domain-containing protein [Streptomyces]RKT03097.1 putative peptidoglycan binding protein [Streptomyces sp. 3211.6]RPF29482.1 putative peptidoglycan binding protein [Streptomyces sp. Ag109_G2-6]
MSPHPDESGPEPDDRLFVRPYVAAPEGPSGPAYPAWPTVPEAGEEPTQPLPRVPAAAQAVPVAAGARHAPGRRGSRLPLAVLALVVLAAGAGTLVFLTSGPEPQDPAPVRPDLALPALPARSPGAGDPEVRAQAATAKPSASAPTRSPSASPSSAKPSTSPTTGAPGRPTQPPDSGTLRPGDKGPAVRELQERLYGQGFTYVRITGVYDGQTKRGVSQLQRDRGIKGDPNGVYGPATRAAFG